MGQIIEGIYIVNITVIGAGNSGLSMAAHLSHHGHKISLWNRSERTISKLLETNTIHVNGIIYGAETIERITTHMSEAIQDTDLILVTTPASSHSDIAKLLAKRLKKDVPIILNPGRTFGAMNFYNTFIQNGGEFTPRIAETQTIIYTCRKNDIDNVTIYSLKKAVKLAALNNQDTKPILQELPECISPYYIPAESFLETSLGNVGFVLHCMPFMLNTGWTECTTSEYKYYYDGITPTISRFIEHIDLERLNVAKALGIELESTIEWMKREYSTRGSTLYDCIQNNKTYKEIDAPKSVYHRYIFEDIPYGMVPFERIGKQLGVDTHYITVSIDLAEALLEENFRSSMPNIDLNTVRSFL